MDAFVGGTDFIYSHGEFYLSTDISPQSLKTKIKRKSKSADFIVSTITSNDIKTVPSNIVKWATGVLLKEELKRYERENQEKLEAFNDICDTVLEDLESQLKGGGQDR